MVALKMIAVILASMVALDHIHETEAGWFSTGVAVGLFLAGKRSADSSCTKVYGIACKTAKVEIGNENNIDSSGSGCKVGLTKACNNQKRQISPITADGLRYVPLPPTFDFYDTNNDDTITFEEFAAQVLPRYPIHDSASLKTMFAAADTNADGVWNKAEFSEAPFVRVSLGTKEVDIPKENEN